MRVCLDGKESPAISIYNVGRNECWEENRKGQGVNVSEARCSLRGKRGVLSI